MANRSDLAGYRVQSKVGLKYMKLELWWTRIITQLRTTNDK